MNRLAFAAVALLAAVPCAALTLSADEAPIPEAQRILVVASQSSGASILMELLGQEASTVAFQDAFIAAPSSSFIGPKHLMASKDIKHVVLKVNLQGDEVSKKPLKRLRDIQEHFMPHKTILVMRHPVENLEHLKKHAVGALPPDFVDTRCIAVRPAELEGGGNPTSTYGLRCGSPEGKLRTLETVYKAFQKNSSLFDAVVHHGDLVDDQGHWTEVVKTMNSIGFPLQLSHFAMDQRTSAEVFERSKGALLKTPRSFKWGMGEVHDGRLEKRARVQNYAQANAQWAQENLPTLMAVHWDTFRSYSM